MHNHEQIIMQNLNPVLNRFSEGRARGAETIAILVICHISFKMLQC